MAHWRKPLARVVETTDGKSFTTLADARAFVLTQPERAPWPKVAGELLKAANSGGVPDIIEATHAFESALFIDGLRLKL